jgi:hypothetical protein
MKTSNKNLPTVKISKIRDYGCTISANREDEISFYPPTDDKGEPQLNGKGIFAVWKPYRDAKKKGLYYPYKKVEVEIIPDGPRKTR